MSQVTTTPLKVAPAAAAEVTLVSGGGAWVPGAWGQVLAATGGTAAVAGLVCSGTISTAFEIDVGAGAAASEVVVTTFRLQFAGAGHSGPFVAWLPRPVTGIASGARLALRHRNTLAAQSVAAALLYYETLDGTNSSALPTQALPAAANSAVVTPNSTAWANSAYAQITSGVGTAISVLGLSFSQPIANVEGEWDLATGGGGSETVITTLRFASAGNANVGGITGLLLPAPYPIAASTRVAVRLRKSGTSTTTYDVALLYDETAPAGPTAVATAEPFVWMPV